MEKFKFVAKNRISKLPKETGVYALSKGAELLYIGKAVNIKERVKQHFQQPSYCDSLFLDKVKKVGYIKTDSEFAEHSAHLTSHPTPQGSTIEALILEANLIKKYRPKYNVVWKDDKNYFYVAITNEEFPRVFITHQLKIKNCKLKIDIIGPFVEGKSLKTTLTFLRKVFPYYTSKSHPRGSCLWCGLRLCPGPNPDRKDYRKNIKNLISVLRGKSGKVLRNLKEEMEKSSVSQDYEKAAKLRDKIISLEKIISHTRVFEPVDLRLQQTVEIDPQQVLRRILNVKKAIRRIEAYDISNIQGKEATGAMVVFTNGQPDKSQYRKFKIKIAGKPNDVAMLKEILSRRFNHLEWPLPDLMLIDGGKAQLNAALSITRNPNFPSRVGAHVKPAGEMWGKAREKLGFRIISLAKRKNELFVEGRKKPVLLKTMPREIFNLILQLRDEAHRFAIAYHHKLRIKTLL